MTSSLKQKGIRAGIAILLISNIVSGTLAIVVIVLSCSSANSLNSIQKQPDHLRKQIDQIYNTVGFTKPTIPVNTAKKEATLVFLSLLKPVSQLSGLDFDDKKEDDCRRKHQCVIRNWADNKGSERHLLWNGMRHEHGSVSVPVTGVYHFHVKFYVENNKKNLSVRHFQQDVVRYDASAGKQESVASSIVSECTEGISNGAHLEYPSDLGCLVQLNAGDQLSVKVSNVGLLKHDRDWHNFGGYLI